MKKNILIVIFLILTQISITNAQDIRLKGLDKEIESLMTAYNAVGLSVSIVENNQKLYSKGFGHRDANKKLSVTENTVFPIGSITKSFTASMLGMLEAEGKLSLNDKPSFYIPKLQFHNDKMDSLITISDLLSHKSGIGSVDGTYILFPASTRQELMGRLKYIKPNGEIKDSWIYSNLGYIIAGLVIEKITNKNWDENIKDKIFNPLSMANSSTSINEMVKSDNYSLGFGIYEKKSQQVLFSELYNDKPGGAINSTVNDMANWMIAWLNQGVFKNKEVLSKSYIQDATSIKAIENGMPPEMNDPSVYTFGYGYGWKVNSQKGHYKVHHGGNVSGFSSQLVIYPTDNLGIVVLTNQHNSILPYIVADIISNRMLTLKRTEWKDYPVRITDINLIDKEIKGINIEKKPTHSLIDYCGKYSNPGFGTFEIISKNDDLYAVFPNFKFRLEHQHYDIFVTKIIQEIPQIMNPEFYINFALDYDGNVSSLKINLQDVPVEFIKQAK